MLPGRLDRPLLVVVVLILLGMGLSSYWNWLDTRESMARGLHARQLLTATTDLISAVKDAETGQRGYLLTGSEAYLAPYTKAVPVIPQLLDRVTEAATTDPSMAADVKLLRTHVEDKMRELAIPIVLRREQGLDAAMKFLLTDAGKNSMDSIRALSEDLASRESNLLNERRSAIAGSSLQTLWLTLGGLGALLFVTVFLQRAVESGIKARELLVNDLDRARQNLEVTLLSIGDAVITSDQRGQVTLMNHVAEELTGWHLADAKGLPVKKIFNIVNDDSSAKAESPVDKVLRTGKVVGRANHTVLISKHGRRISIDDSGAPIRNRQDQVLGVVLVFRDISKRRAQEIEIEQWKRIFEQAGFGVVILDNDGETIVNANAAFARMHGYAPEELRDKSFAALVARESSYEIGPPPNEDHAIYELVHKRKDGTFFDAITDMTVFRDAQGEPVMRAAYFADISDRKTAEIRLRHSAERFRAAAEAMGDVIWTSNPKGEIIEEQPSWAAFSGQTFEEYRGVGAAKAVHPEDAALFQAWEKVLAHPQKFTAEVRMRRHDGQYRLMLTTTVPIFNNDGSVREWVGALSDLTDRRRNEEEVRESDERFQGLATAFPQLVWSSKPDGSLEYANSLWKEYAGGQTESTSENAPWDSLVHPEDVGAHMERWKDSMASGTMFESQARLRHSSDGTYRWFICRAVAVRGRGNRIVRWLGACTDINEQMNYAGDLRQANEALQRSNADLEQFAYAASHDLQEPLRMISLYTQLLQEEYSSSLDGPARSYVDFAVSGAQRMERLLQDLMAYSRVSADPQNALEVSDANVAVQEALGNLEATVRKSCATFHIGELPSVAAPSVHLVLLFQNLLSNALKYSGGKIPEVSINAERVDKFCRFSIKDNGIGIDQQYAKQIFGVFKRLHGAEYEGTGIGLAVCQRIVERTGGRIWLESTPGGGSTFYFTLPLAG